MSYPKCDYWWFFIVEFLKELESRIHWKKKDNVISELLSDLLPETYVGPGWRNLDIHNEIYRFPLNVYINLFPRTLPLWYDQIGTHVPGFALVYTWILSLCLSIKSFLFLFYTTTFFDQPYYTPSTMVSSLRRLEIFDLFCASV